MNHYFKSTHKNPLNRKRIPFRFLGVDIEFESHENIFSKDHVDEGTQLLLSSLPPLQSDSKVLDLGCGYGVVGITIKKLTPQSSVYCSDINEDALALCELNAKLNEVELQCIHSDGFQNIHQSFDKILFNPPIRVGKAILFPLYLECMKHLETDGTLWMVIRKDKGAQSTMNFLIEQGYQVKKITQDKGFWIIACRH